MAGRVDLNADLGELPGPSGAALDAALLDVVTSANVACGGHAGDGASMLRTARAAAARGVSVGAHVSYPDRENFGRRDVGYPPAVLLSSLRAQIEDLMAAAAEAGTAVRYIKAHGALYNASVLSDAPAAILLETAREFGLPVLTQHAGVLAQCAASSGVGVYAEFFADRAYGPTGSLVPRHDRAAVITDAGHVVHRVIAAVRDATVISSDGTVLAIRADSICLHGDTPGALRLAVQVRRALLAHPLALAPFIATAPRP